MESQLIIRTAVAGSIVGHLVLAMGLIFAEAHPFSQVPSETIAVDLVAPGELPPPEGVAEPLKEQPPANDLPLKEQLKPSLPEAAAKSTAVSAATAAMPPPTQPPNAAAAASSAPSSSAPAQGAPVRQSAVQPRPQQ